MKVLVVGSGGREHAVIRKLAENPGDRPTFFARRATAAFQRTSPVGVEIKATDVDGMVAFAKEKEIDFVVVAPDDPLVLGMVDALEEAGIPAFGPSNKAAAASRAARFSPKI